MIRRSAVAGHFYKGTPDSLQKQVRSFLVPTTEKKIVLGAMVPHAGLMYSGRTAGAVYSCIAVPETVVLIGPNHTGMGAPVSLMANGSWETPLGIVDVNGDLAARILDRSSLIREDALAHLHEHSLEVQLPFLQQLRDRFRIVPIQMLDTRFNTCIEVGNAIASAIREKSAGESDIDRARVLIIASSDMSHYVSADTAKKKDEKAIDAVMRRDPRALYQAVREYGISMCGYGPTIAVLTACNELGATRTELVSYTNSGDASGDYEQVVGYAGIIIL